jgi:hypothetical protein
LALADVEKRVRRLERENRVLVVLLAAVLAVASIAASNAQPTVVTAGEIRAQRFTLLDPNGGVADDWYATSPQDGATTRSGS